MPVKEICQLELDVPFLVPVKMSAFDFENWFPGVLNANRS